VSGGLVHIHSASSLNLSGTEDLGELCSELLGKLDVGAAPPRRIVISSHRELHRLPLLAMKVRLWTHGPAQCICDAFSGGVYFVPNLFMYALMCANNPPGREAPLSKSALRDPKFVAFTGPNVGSAREVVERVKSTSLFQPNMAICVDTFQNGSTPESYSKSADVEDCDVLHFTAHGWPAVPDTARYNPSHALVDAGLLLHHESGVPTIEDPG
jgi:hypothetical protein